MSVELSIQTHFHAGNSDRSQTAMLVLLYYLHRYYDIMSSSICVSMDSESTNLVSA